jgi:threonine/homoserine/homoserine lactone efflux protein
MNALVNGILFGLLLSILIGPVFFALIQTSIQKGFRLGAWLAVGISLSDLLYIAVCYVGFTQFFELAHFKESLAMAGGIIMFMFGISALLKPINQAAGLTLDRNRNTIFRQIMKGFFLNAANPFVILFWVGVVIKVTVTDGYAPWQVPVFFAGTVLTVFMTDLSKAYVAHRLRQYLTTPLLTWMNRIVGVTLLGFGARLMFYAFNGL